MLELPSRAAYASTCVFDPAVPAAALPGPGLGRPFVLGSIYTALERARGCVESDLSVYRHISTSLRGPRVAHVVVERCAASVL
eukprot:scaffold9745_cov45-Phaeocystis_antarctica.AAC.2